MNIQDFLDHSTKKLQKTEVSTARLDCLVLLEDATGRDRAWLLAHPEFELSSEQLELLRDQVKRRAKHEPLAYIRGKAEFYGREFIVNTHTLQPRPETEAMIELALNLIESKKLKVERIVDAGTGSGAIAVTMKLQRPDLEVIATDIDEECIKAAKKNATKLGAEVTMLQGNLLEPLYNLSPIASNLFAVLANLPYVPDEFTVNQAATFEPKHALFGGPDGLDLYREMFSQTSHINKPKYILTESLPFQHNELARIASGYDYKLQQTADLIQLFTSNL